MIDVFCDRLTYLIKSSTPDIDDEKAEIINFGIKSIVSEITKTAILLTVAYFLGVLKLVVIAIIGFGIYRSFAGGFHARTHLACLASNSAILFINICLSILIPLNSIDLIILYAVVYIFNCIMIYLYAPADVEEKPILSKKLRRGLRIKSFIIMSLIFVLTLVFIKDTVIANILIFSTFFESLTLTPISYKIMRCRHGYGETI